MNFEINEELSAVITDYELDLVWSLLSEEGLIYAEEQLTGLVNIGQRRRIIWSAVRNVPAGDKEWSIIIKLSDDEDSKLREDCQSVIQQLLAGLKITLPKIELPNIEKSD